MPHMHRSSAQTTDDVGPVHIPYVPARHLFVDPYRAHVVISAVADCRTKLCAAPAASPDFVNPFGAPDDRNRPTVAKTFDENATAARVNFVANHLRQ